MRRVLVPTAALLLAAGCADLTGSREATGRAGLEEIARVLGAPPLRSLRYAGTGEQFAVGQSAAPSAPWPRFHLTRYARSISYDTGAMRDELVRTQGEQPPRGGGQQPVRGEQRQVFVVSGEQAWNVAGDAAIPAPMALADRQLQLWTTPHGLVKAALERGGQLDGDAIAIAVPGRFRARATVDRARLIERVDAVVAHPVVGDLPVRITYADYRRYGAILFPTRIRHEAAGFPSLDLRVTDVQPNAPVDIAVPDGVRQATGVYARVAAQMVAPGVWYLTGGSHHSAVIEMRDHLILVEAPLNDERALAVLAEARSLAPDKPVRYVVNSHHHFDHAGGIRAAAAEAEAIVTHEVNRSFFERVLAAPAGIAPDHLARAGRRAAVEGVRDRRVLSDGSRTVEIHHIAGNAHHDGLLMVYLPAERILIQADAYTPGPPDAPPPTPASPFTVNLADNIAQRRLAVDRLLPLHGRIVPLAELHRAIGRTH